MIYLIIDQEELRAQPFHAKQAELAVLLRQGANMDQDHRLYLPLRSMETAVLCQNLTVLLKQLL